MLNEARVQINRKNILFHVVSKNKPLFSGQIQILCRDIKNLDCLQNENFTMDESIASDKMLVMDLIIERIMRERDHLEDIIEDIDRLVRKYN